MQGLGQRRPRQFDTGFAAGLACGCDGRTQLHTRRDITQRDFDLYRATLRRNGRADFPHMAQGLDLGIVHQADGDGFATGRRDQQRLIDIEHRIALAIVGQGEDWRRSLHHLPDFSLTFGDHPGRIGDQCGVAQLITGIGQLRLGGLQGALATAQRRLGGVVLALAGIALGQQFLLTDKGGGALGHPRLFGEHFGLG
ncbi:hypothetical protein D9M71_427460 [compost metagenome]